MRTRWHAEVVAFIDCLLALTVVLLALTVLVEPTKKADADPIKPLGAMDIVLSWLPTSQDADVDLWVLAPGSTPVGYSNKSAPGMALLRDDLGLSADPDAINVELAKANFLRPGEYVVNAHLYRARVKPPIHCKLVVTVRHGQSTDTLYRGEFDLMSTGEEHTVVRFTLDDKGNLVPGSINTLPMGLRAP